ncbi:MAG: trimethylamine methyltransferase family protein [bacterium]
MEGIEKIIHDDARYVLENIGVGAKSQKIIDTFEGSYMAGYDSSIGRIYILKDLINCCIDSAPKRSKHPVPEHSFGGGGVAAFLEQGDDYITPNVNTHTAEIFRIANEFNIPFMFKGCSAKQTPEEEVRQLEVMRDYYDEYIYTRVETPQGIEKALQDYENTGMLATTHSIINSPLKFNETGKNVEAFYDCAEKGLPLYMTSMPISTLTGPASMYGMAVLSYAEFLASMVLSQLINPGVMAINGAFPTAGNPSNGYQPALGTLFHNQMNYLAARVSNVCDFPSIQSGCTITGQHHIPIGDGYTDYETENGLRCWNRWKDWHQVRHTLGFVNNLAAFNIDKMRRDAVSLERVLKNNYQTDIEVDDVYYDNEAYDAIKQGSLANNFKDIDHTVKNVGVFQEYLAKTLPLDI